MEMNKLGLIGGTGPESTIVYYKGIEYGVQQKSGRSFFPNLAIESLSVFDILGFCERQDHAGLTAYLLKGISNLAAAGAQYGALTGITPHIVFDELAKASPVPLISMVDTARDFAVAHGYGKICLLGTLPTMEGVFFQNSFAKRGIDVVTPNAKEKNYIGTKIETELEFGKVLPDTQQKFKEIVERIIREEQVQAVVLGCTELPLIFDGVELSVPYIDVMQVHIDVLVDLIMRD
ncbi:aspartate racemase [Oribacterium sp. oral taxon 078 str. F0263]|uniref:aspartate/glutamate racemase family protein n=1 Tax=Oribacterium sp. oral taxon 078 TaxID=652706 RepID=UPI0003ADD41E|nr:amino acid racemase [Oribacterium sp. oral taxon 078]ERL21972.1 aspartate racemase [Oribacterium sp. oral taxon 078 str. F0263]